MTSEQVAKVLSSLGKRKVCFQHEDKVEIVNGINVTNDNVILISELPSGIKENNMKTIDWEQRRYEIAKEIFPLALQTSFGAKTKEEDKDIVASYVVEWADALIEKLKDRED